LDRLGMARRAVLPHTCLVVVLVQPGRAWLLVLVKPGRAWLLVWAGFWTCLPPVGLPGRAWLRV
jgi:hypothetical protein